MAFARGDSIAIAAFDRFTDGRNRHPARELHAERRRAPSGGLESIG